MKVKVPFPDVSAVPDSIQPRWISSSALRLLDVAPELGQMLDSRRFAQVRDNVSVRAVRLQPGRWQLEELERVDGVHAPIKGIMLVEGWMTMDVAFAGRRCTRLLTAGELVLTDGAAEHTMPASWSWTSIGQSVVAILDRQMLLIGRHLPRLLSALLQRAAEQTREALLVQAISQLPRVDDRLLALFWSIADRVGIVAGEAVRIELPLTHGMLAQMIGAQRPTVSLALARLHDQGLLCSDSGYWLLSRASLGRLRPAA